MPSSEETVAVLFADVCGSTPLYEGTGDMAALGIIGDCVDGLAEVTRNNDGRVVRSHGDDILATFADADRALEAASVMIERQKDSSIDIHVGIHYGSVVNARDDIFGDAVNVAARMLALSKPGEILVTEALAEQLSRVRRAGLRLLERHTVKGKSSPMDVYIVVTDEEEVTRAVSDGSSQKAIMESMGHPGAAKASITLVYNDRKVVRTYGDSAFRIGRSQACDLVIEEACVSREHAVIEVHRGKVILTDRSSTGTWITGQGEEIVFLRRDAMQINGAGVMSLGRRPFDDGPTLIHFRKTIES